MAQLDACVVGGEPPVGGGAEGITALLPSGRFITQGVLVGNARVKDLSVEDTQFDFSHVEPTAVFGRVMDLQLLDNAPRLGGRKGFVE